MFFPGSFLLLRNSYKRSLFMPPNTPDFISHLYMPVQSSLSQAKNLGLFILSFPRSHSTLLIILSPCSLPSLVILGVSLLRWDNQNCIQF